MKNPKFSVAASSTKKPKITFSRLIRSSPRSENTLASAPVPRRVEVLETLTGAASGRRLEVGRNHRAAALRVQAFDGVVGRCDRWSAIDRATMAASWPTPNSTADLRLSRKWTPQKNRPGTTVLAPL